MEKVFMRKRSENNPQTLMGSDLDSLSKWQPIFVSSKEVRHQFRESIRIHVSANIETGIAFSVNTSCREEIFGNINTDEGSKTQVIWSSPAYPVLMGKTHAYKFYKTNS